MPAFPAGSSAHNGKDWIRTNYILEVTVLLSPHKVIEQMDMLLRAIIWISSPEVTLNLSHITLNFGISFLILELKVLLGNSATEYLNKIPIFVK